MPAVESLMRLVTTQLPALRYKKYEISGIEKPSFEAAPPRQGDVSPHTIE
jgi:hypothetical protein